MIFYLFQIIKLGILYSLLSLGLALILGVMDVLNFAHGSFMMLGAYTSYILSSSFGVNYLLVIPISFFIVGLIGIVSDKLVFKRIDTKLGIIASFGLIFIFRNSVSTLFTTEWLQYDIEGFLAERILIGTFSISVNWIMGIIVSLSMLGIFLYVFYRTKTGLAMRALSQNPMAAEVIGISPSRIYSFVFLLGTGMASVAGTVYGGLYYIDLSMGLMPLLLSFCIIIVAGLRKISVLLIGSFFIATSQVFGTYMVGSAFQYFFPFLSAVVVLLIKPRGLG